MSNYVFPDNTVLCNFASIDRLDLLRAVLDGDGRWSEAVAYEASRSVPYIPGLAGLQDADWLGDPIEITDEDEIQRVETIRRAVFGGRENNPLRHLGESQTCFLIKESGRFDGSWWVSDDREAVRYARRQGIVTCETADLMSIAVTKGNLADTDALPLLHAMAANGRRLTIPDTLAKLRS